jgi:uncharacterized membrane protein (UPF0127 family)
VSTAKRHRVVNATRNAVLADKAEKADDAWARFVGLMGRAGLAEGEGMEITRCSGIHTFFMRFALDVLFLDDAGTVIRAIEAIAPWRMTRFYSAATRVVELPPGVISRSGTKEGDRIEVSEIS